jgi:hypothetical protein
VTSIDAINRIQDTRGTIPLSNLGEWGMEIKPMYISIGPEIIGDTNLALFYYMLTK